MFKLQINKSIIKVKEKEPIVSGASNIYSVSFEFDSEWDNLMRTAVFKVENTAIDVILEENKCSVPWEVLSGDNVGKALWVGVFGSDEDGVRLPAIWNQLGIIHPGTERGVKGKKPRADIVAQIYSAAKEAEKKASEALNVANNAIYTLTDDDKAEIANMVISTFPNGDEVMY
ncbi:MAG: hypothetical protein IKT56_03270 [Clostridia bacterium]|nr:hypothetical protein [Clostridia bacterium]